ncbi:MAG: ATP-binding protein [Solirubrobacterales bacterium]
MAAVLASDGDTSSAKAPSGSLALVKPAVPETIGLLRRATVEFAAVHGAPVAIVDDIALAVSEAATNAVKHANVAGGEGIVELTAAVADDWIDIRVRDRGKGFGTRPSDGLGLGLSIIASVSVYLTICQEGHGTEVRMRFPLPR